LETEVDDLSADVYHLDVLHIVLFFVSTKGNVSTFICLNALFEIGERALRVFALVIRSPEL
jgi:hypothetical protein